MMRRLIVLVTFALACTALWGCVVRHHGGPHPRGRGRCYTSCAQYAQRQSCQRRCSVWRNGVCMRYSQSCTPQRYCVRNVTRCN